MVWTTPSMIPSHSTSHQLGFTTFTPEPMVLVELAVPSSETWIRNFWVTSSQM